MPKIARLAFGLALWVAATDVACAQSAATTAAQQGAKPATAPSMVSPPTTVAPTRDGTATHVVPTPTEAPRTTKTGGNTNGGAN